MPCESCAVQFSVFKRKRVCCECERYYCSGCLRRGGGAMCAPCRVLSTRPLTRNTISHLKVRDLQCFLQRQNISTRGCVEKDDLVSLCVCHVNSASYRRRGARATGAFSSLKGLTNNINEFINSAFDLRTPPAPTPAPAPPRHPPRQTTSCHSDNCVNSTHSGHPVDARPAPERFTPTPGGERRIEVPPPEESGAEGAEAEAEGAARRDTADCYEIEDLDDGGWEVVYRPADPLPNDSEILLTAEGGADATPPPPPPHPAAGHSPASSHSDFDRISANNHRAAVFERLSAGVCEARLSPGGRVRASSELELRPAASASASASPDTASLQDEPAPRVDSAPATPPPASPPARAAPVTLESIAGEEALGALSVRQLKELLARNRVALAGCVERGELLELAARLWRAHRRERARLDELPLDECCKICMAAPLECVLLECGHIAACTACAARLAECPICRRYVVRAVRFFRS